MSIRTAWLSVGVKEKRKVNWDGMWTFVLNLFDQDENLLQDLCDVVQNINSHTQVPSLLIQTKGNKTIYLGN